MKEKRERTTRFASGVIGWIGRQSAHTGVEYVYAIILVCVSVANIIILASAGKTKVEAAPPPIEAVQPAVPVLKRQAVPEPAKRVSEDFRHRVKLERLLQVGSSGGELSKSKSRVM
jgi:hypothetical protein